MDISICPRRMKDSLPRNGSESERYSNLTVGSDFRLKGKTGGNNVRSPHTCRPLTLVCYYSFQTVLPHTTS